jgi:hypothetical protein
LTAVLAQTPAPATPVTPATPPPATPKTGAPATVKPLPVPGSAKPPKIPLTAVTPKPAATAPSTSPAGTTTPATTPKTTTTGASTPTKAPPPPALVLDTNAAQTYNPYAYRAGNFGDPSLAIDGDRSTAWTAQVEPSVAPRMAEGLAFDLKTGQRLSALVLLTTTPGMAIQVYGANGQALPASITDPAWVQLSALKIETKRHVRIKLRDSTTAFRFLTLWISKAPAASVGSTQAPGYVSVNEIELFPPAK